MSALLFLYWGRPQPFLPCLLRVAGHHPTGLAGNILERNHRNLKVAVFLRVLFGLILFQTETDTDCAPRSISIFRFHGSPSGTAGGMRKSAHSPYSPETPSAVVASFISIGTNCHSSCAPRICSMVFVARNSCFQMHGPLSQTPTPLDFPP